MEVPNAVERAETLVKKGESVLATHRPNSPGVIGFPTLDSGAFAEWRAQSISFLTQLLGGDHPYANSFSGSVQRGFTSSTNAGIGILRAVLEDLRTGAALAAPQNCGPDFVARISNICDRFHIVARQLRSRYGGRATLDVSDEYDVQDLLHALLRLEFDDVRAEEYTPSYAGKASRMDFLIKQEKIVVECKRSRHGFGARELGSQLIEDVTRYRAHDDCETLICFAYDPEGRIANPRGVETDLSQENGEPRVVVLIRP